MKTAKATVLVAMAGLFATPLAAAELGAVDEPIKLAVNEWTGQHITTLIAGHMLKEAGYKVEYITAGYQNMWPAMAEGDLDAAVEVWESNVPQGYYQLRDGGRLEDLGALGLDAREGFVYPAYMEEQCPGLPDWQALAACAANFATVETLPQGRLVDYPGEWGTPGADRMAALNLPFKAIPAGSEGALVAEFKAAQSQKTPLLAVFWQPHWAITAFDLKFTKLPEGTEACYADASAGPNPDVTGDCDFLPTRVFKAAWPGLKEKWPAAHEILTNLQLSVEQQQPLMGAVDVDGRPAEQVVAEWVAANESAWRPIVDAAIR
ncbi:glycine betaine/proline transport system substrate-binding protein [Paracoccus halophilus]|uniref:Glycine betaine/proline transport system substrate-binding protein n=2 Tax=Paracoccus halophilus TaxID=376733 RepID=A0A099EZ30_9RHOB|nr:glycine/betaine ABC transporter substrate-binding protein [Paracoccus halophilus]SFA52740.1 glycine betaine/proline transport system substrate-binding protein [Paracoccus halophilus]